MLNFKEYLIEATLQKLWSDALNSKPEKYGAGFAAAVEKDTWFTTVDGKNAVKLDKSNTTLLNVFKDALSKEGLIDKLVAADEGEKVLKWTTTSTGKKQAPKWKVVKSNKKVDYIKLNDLGKENVKPSDTPTGGEWESMISIGYNMQRLEEEYPLEDSAKKDEGYGIPVAEWQSMMDSFWLKWGESAVEVGKAFYAESDFAHLKMTQYGKGKGILTGPWKTWHTGGRKNTTPKTDMYVGEGGTGQRISLKKVGGGQVMSAAEGESIATFNAALAWMGEEDNAEVGKMIEEVKEGFKKVTLGGSITDLKAGKGFASAGTMDAKKRDALLADIATQDDVHDTLSKNMNTLFNNNADLKKWFLYEAATGSKKFGLKDKATADFVVEFDPSKKQSGAIKKYKDLRNPDGKDLKDLVAETQFYCAFKTGAKNPYTATRTKFVKAEKRANKNEQFEFDNIDDMPTLRHLIIDHIESNELTRTFLPENFEQLDEFALLNRAIQGIKRGASRLKAGAKEMYLNLTVRVKKFVEGLIEKVGMVLDKIKKLAGKALHALLKFFGFEVDKVTSSGPSLVFGKMG